MNVTSTIVSDAGFAVVIYPTGFPTDGLSFRALACEDSGGFRLFLVEVDPKTLARLERLGCRWRMIDQPCTFGKEDCGRFRLFTVPDDESNGHGGPWFAVALDDAARETLQPGFLTPCAVFGNR